MTVITSRDPFYRLRRETHPYNVFPQRMYDCLGCRGIVQWVIRGTCSQELFTGLSCSYGPPSRIFLRPQKFYFCQWDGSRLCQNVLSLVVPCQHFSKVSVSSSIDFLFSKGREV